MNYYKKYQKYKKKYTAQKIQIGGAYAQVHEYGFPKSIINIEVDETDTIETIKQKIHNATNHPIESLTLVYDKSEIFDSKPTMIYARGKSTPSTFLDKLIKGLILYKIDESVVEEEGQKETVEDKLRKAIFDALQKTENATNINCIDVMNTLRNDLTIAITI